MMPEMCKGANTPLENLTPEQELIESQAKKIADLEEGIDAISMFIRERLERIVELEMLAAYDKLVIDDQRIKIQRIAELEAQLDAIWNACKEYDTIEQIKGAVMNIARHGAENPKSALKGEPQ
jgi:hypothetical protein